MQIECQTDVGKKRKMNQDFVDVFYNHEKVPFAVIADGMGGHQGGDVASEMAVSHIGDAWTQTHLVDSEEIVKWLVQHVQYENQRIIDTASKYDDLIGMGTTIVAAVLLEKQFIVVNVGDSRAYLYRDDSLKQITEDHTLVNELLKRGEITEDEAQHHPRRNVLVRSLGGSDMVEADVNILQVEPEDYLLLCSDGLSNMVPDNILRRVLAEPTKIKAKRERLIELANDEGGLDNITVILVHYDSKREEGQV